ncbi:MAG: beta-galactosidase, partial [Carboxylicivirga sp.]|nr:beta-galactosidase [Carboxylicivirga sp.]
MRKSISIVFIVLLILSNGKAQDAWQLNTDHILSKWAKEVTAENVHQEYPRPHMEREKWMNLNGLW